MHPTTATLDPSTTDDRDADIIRLFDPDPRQLQLVLPPPRRPDLPMLVAGFLHGYTKAATRKGYAHDLESWHRFLDPIGVDPLTEVRRSHVDAWSREGLDAGLTPATIGRRLAALGSWYRWLLAEELADRDPTIGARRPKVPKESTKPALSRVELTDLLRAADLEPPHPRALAYVLAHTGCRIGELCAADVTDVTSSGWHRILTFRTTKNGKPREVVLNPPCYDALQPVLEGRTSGPLLLTAAGTRMNRAAAARTLERLAAAAEIRTPVSPHTFRHTYVTLLLRAGVDPSVIQHNVGHADLKTTLLYDHRRQTHDGSPSYLLAQYLAA